MTSDGRQAVQGAATTKARAAAPERIAKLLARAGIASRRDAERLVLDGRVRLNGRVLDTPAATATLADRIEIDGSALPGIERTRLWLYHKPAGLVTTHKDPENRPTVFERLPLDLPRIVSVGRLDIATEGLMLLTNDGGLARALELPQTGWLRRYRARAHGSVDQRALDRLREGMAIDGMLYGSIEATLERVQGANVWMSVGLREGKNREIKNVLAVLGLEVNRLIRVSYGPFQLGGLAPGAVREIRGRTLRDQLGRRLIERSGANFDAPLFTAMRSDGRKGSPTVRDSRDTGRPADGKSGRRPVRPGGKRGDGAGRRDTDRREDGGHDAGASAEPQSRRNRASNAWMAPDARPQAVKRISKGVADRKKAKPAARASRRKEADGGEAGGRPGKPRMRKEIAGKSKSHRSSSRRATARKPPGEDAPPRGDGHADRRR